MSDVFDLLVGQERVQQSLREYVRHPVHAYLFSGPSGAPVAETALAFVAALECPQQGCGSCEVCRRVLDGHEADVHIGQRTGASWSVEDIHELERVARRRPLRAPFNVVVVEDVELTVSGGSPSAAALLKTLEEPAPRTIFVLTAEELPEELITIESRCVSIALRGLDEDQIVALLVRDGASESDARSAASSANGNLRRAQVLVNDPALAARLHLWRSAPEQLNGTASSAATVALAIGAAITEALGPLVALQNSEMDRLSAQAKEMGLRAVPGRAKLEQTHKREQRRFRLDELRFGLSVLTQVYRARMLEQVGSLRDAHDQHELAVTIEALEVVHRASQRLTTTMDENLLVHDLLLSLMRL